MGSFWDSIDIEINDNKNSKDISLIKKGNCLKRLVSKKKRRLENEKFDLDLAYITKRVIATGYPSIGFESIFRNSREETIGFFKEYHYKNAKVNLLLFVGLQFVHREGPYIP